MAEEDPRFRNAQTYVAPAGAYVAPSNTYLTPNGAPVTPPPPAPPPQPSMRARALAEILSQTRYTVADSGDNEGDPSTIRPKFYANMNNVLTQRYGGDYIPSDRYDIEVRPEANDGEYLYSLMDKLGPGVAENFAVDGSDSDEDMMARNMTRFMRAYQNAGPSSSIYVPEDDLALALAEIYATEPGAAPRQTDSRGHPGQEDAENRGLGGVAYNNMTFDQVADAMVNGVAVGTPGVTTPGYGPGSNFGGAKPKYGDRLGGFKDVAKFSGAVPLGLQVLASIMDDAHNPFGPGYAKLDALGRPIPGTYKGGAGYSPGRTGFTGPGGQTGQAGTGSDGPSGGGGGIST